jgi:hypothetical protein
MLARRMLERDAISVRDGVEWYLAGGSKISNLTLKNFAQPSSYLVNTQLIFLNLKLDTKAGRYHFYCSILFETL